MIPLWLFISKIKAVNQETQIYAVCGSLVVMSYMIFGFTQSSFSHNSGVVMYGALVVFFWAAIRSSEPLELTKIDYHSKI